VAIPNRTEFNGIESPELRTVRELASIVTDINEHLELMFTEALLSRPQTIVELGVRTGVSTAVFTAVANLYGASVVSVDLGDCSKVTTYRRWYFHQGDDVAFASAFPSYCQERGISPLIDLLFIDTSHYYVHTVEEIRAWFPMLSPAAKVMFHDTNMRTVGRRRDGCFELAWDNDRGVIRGIEELLGISVDESRETSEIARGWLLRHFPWNNGFTILDRISEACPE
jgi:cephalosporin hydroxylase